MLDTLLLISLTLTAPGQVNSSFVSTIINRTLLVNSCVCSSYALYVSTFIAASCMSELVWHTSKLVRSFFVPDNREYNHSPSGLRWKPQRLRRYTYRGESPVHGLRQHFRSLKSKILRAIRLLNHYTNLHYT